VDDEIVHVKNAEWLFRNISSTSKEIIYLGDSYHMITIDNEFDIVNRHTADFLKKSVNYNHAYLMKVIFNALLLLVQSGHGEARGIMSAEDSGL
jgi:hypothetical protein